MTRKVIKEISQILKDNSNFSKSERDMMALIVAAATAVPFNTRIAVVWPLMLKATAKIEKILKTLQSDIDDDSNSKPKKLKKVIN